MWNTKTRDSRPREQADRGRGVSAAAVAVLGLASLVALAGCQSAKEAYADTFLAGRTITYDEYLELNVEGTPATTVEDVILSLGKPSSVHDRNGARRRLDYHAFSMTGELKRAEFHFDREERLTKKAMW